MISPVLETRHLSLLVALEKAGSLNAAARELHLTPSALSQQLRDIEGRLGGALFTRQWRRLVLTPAGRRLTDAAKSLLQELSRVEEETRSLMNGTSGTIRFTTACLYSYGWIPELLRSWSRNWPGVQIAIVAEATAAPAEWLLQRKLDVALMPGDIRLDPRLRIQPLFRDELVALVGRGHPWFGKRSVDVRAFAGEHMWSDERAFDPDTPLGRALAEAGGIRPRKVTTIPMTGGVPVEMARANLGITVVPRWTVESALEQGDLHAVRIGRGGLWHEWATVTRAEDPTPSLARFLEALKTHHPRAKRKAS